jgi:hypothetical protein
MRLGPQVWASFSLGGGLQLSGGRKSCQIWGREEVGWKEEVTFLKKGASPGVTKKLLYPRLLSGHSLAAQPPGVTKVFCALFFKKALLSAASLHRLVFLMTRGRG